MIKLSIAVIAALLAQSTRAFADGSAVARKAQAQLSASGWSLPEDGLQVAQVREPKASRGEAPSATAGNGVSACSVMLYMDGGDVTAVISALKSRGYDEVYWNQPNRTKYTMSVSVTGENEGKRGAGGLSHVVKGVDYSNVYSNYSAYARFYREDKAANGRKQAPTLLAESRSDGALSRWTQDNAARFRELQIVETQRALELVNAKIGACPDKPGN